MLVFVAVIAAIVVLAILLGTVFPAPGQNSKANLEPNTRLPPGGIAAQTFNPPAVGVSLSVPATWRAASRQVGGFDYAMLSPGPPIDYVLVTRSELYTKTTAGSLQHQRVHFLSGIGNADISASRIGVIHNQPAVQIRYHFKKDGVNSDIVEYDIALGKQGTIFVAIGVPAGHPDAALTDWIASTITLAPTTTQRS